MTPASQRTARWRERRPNYMRDYYRNLRREVIAAYGGRCACCGEDTPEFLTLDHVNDDGNVERAQKGYSNTKLFLRLRREGWPPGYAVLCWNCNAAKAFYSGCPHGPKEI